MESLSSKVWEVRWLNGYCWRVATLLKIEIEEKGNGILKRMGSVWMKFLGSLL